MLDLPGITAALPHNQDTIAWSFLSVPDVGKFLRTLNVA